MVSTARCTLTCNVMRPVIQINQFCIPNAPLPWGLPYWCDGCTEKIKDRRSKESVRIAGYIHASQNMKSNYNNTTTQGSCNKKPQRVQQSILMKRQCYLRLVARDLAPRIVPPHGSSAEATRDIDAQQLSSAKNVPPAGSGVVPPQQDFGVGFSHHPHQCP